MLIGEKCALRTKLSYQNALKEYSKNNNMKIY